MPGWRRDREERGSKGEPERRSDRKRERKPRSRSSCLVCGADEEESEKGKARAGKEDGQKGRGADRTKCVSEGVSEGG